MGQTPPQGRPRRGPALVQQPPRAGSFQLCMPRSSGALSQPAWPSPCRDCGPAGEESGTLDSSRSVRQQHGPRWGHMELSQPSSVVRVRGRGQAARPTWCTAPHFHAGSDPRADGLRVHGSCRWERVSGLWGPFSPTCPAQDMGRAFQTPQHRVHRVGLSARKSVRPA